MIGHELVTHETNQRHLIGLCSCGWIGSATTWRTTINARTQRATVNKNLTIDVVTREHGEHLRDVTADIEARSATALERNAEAVSRLIPTTLRPGRFGAGN